MSRRSITKDERFLLSIYHVTGKDTSTSVQEEILRQHEGLTEATARNIINLLAQTGFVSYRKKDGLVSITEKGISLCHELNTPQ